jgi:hypothetical protein
MTAPIDGTKDTFYQLTTREWLKLCNLLNLSFAAMKVLMYLRTINPWGDRTVEAETKDLAKALNLNIRTVQRCLHELDDKKLIELEFNRFKFTLKSHVATSTSPNDQNVATSTSPNDQNVATSTSPNDQNVATSTSFTRLTDRLNDTEIAGTTSMSRSPSESVCVQGFQEPSYSSYSLDVLNNPPKSPHGGDGGIANAVEEQEAIAHEPEESEQNTTSVNNSSSVKGQSSAPPEIRAVRKFYPETPPPWRWGYCVNEYHSGFVEFVRKLLAEMPETSAMKSLSAEGLISHYETPKGFANLEARCKQWQEAETKRQQTAAAQASAMLALQESAPPPLHPTPSINLSEAIAALMQEQGLTPAAVLERMRSSPLHKGVFARLPADPIEAWQQLGIGQQSIIYSQLQEPEHVPIH